MRAMLFHLRSRYSHLSHRRRRLLVTLLTGLGSAVFGTLLIAHQYGPVGFKQALGLGAVLLVAGGAMEILITEFKERRELYWLSHPEEFERRRSSDFAKFNLVSDLVILTIIALVGIRLSLAGIWPLPLNAYRQNDPGWLGGMVLATLGVAWSGFSAIQTAFRQLTGVAVLVLVVRLAQIIVMFGWIYFIAGITGPGGRAQTFGPCLYFSVITITTLGYGDWIPLPQSRVFAAAEALVGYIYMALFIAALTTYMNRKPAEER